MSDIALAAARVLARHHGHAIPIIEASLISPDRPDVFGIAPIRVVSEQRVQAIAFGPLDRAPEILTIWNPLSRESHELTPFATALASYLDRAMEHDGLPRIWLPHSSALEILELLGERYRTNPNASPELQVMGWQCRAIAQESKYPGQQVVILAGDALRSHVVTGQSGIEDQHLGALLVWLEPHEGIDPVLESERQATIPAAAMLSRPVDDEVERLRNVAKRATPKVAAEARRAIENHLRRGAQHEWDLLVRARAAFWALRLPAISLGDLVSESRERLEFALSFKPSPASKAHSLSRLLHSFEFSMDLVEDARMRGDRSARERARKKGKAVAARVVAVEQPKPGRHPCTLTLRTTQTVLRVRKNTRLQTLDGRVVGHVLAVREDGDATLITLRLEKGVQSTRRPAQGTDGDWVDGVVYDGRYLRNQIYSALKVSEPQLVYGIELPASAPRAIAAPNLTQLSESLRKR
jgi:hypothetical protein